MQPLVTRRAALQCSLGTIALQTLLAEEARASGQQPVLLHHAPSAKRVIVLFQSGGPSQIDLFDHKPELMKRFGEEVPSSVYPEARKTTQTSAQKSFATAPSLFQFARHGECGTWVSELLPHTAPLMDELCVIKSTYTEAINHDPAITFWQTGSQLPGRPSLGSWITYGLGSENSDLPMYVAMSSKGTGRPNGQPLYSRLWGSGFLPSKYQGLKFRNQGDPVLDLPNPAGVDRDTRRTMVDTIGQLNRLKFAEIGDPEILTRIAQYELAFRMQNSVPVALNFSEEPKHVLDAYGPDVSKQGSYAYNCLTARRLAERGVRFIQLFHQGWDLHFGLPGRIREQCRDTDQPTAALLRDLKNRNLLEDTLVVWCGEFGRTVYSQGELSKDNYGRDHHPGCFTTWMAGGGVKGGMSYGKTDDYSTNVIENGVHVHDLHATILHLLGIDHERLTYTFQGRDFRLTDVEGTVVKDILA